MTNEIVWVYGSSAVGKETFIRRMTTNPPRDFLKRMGWNNKKIIMISESIEILAHLFPRDVEEKRKEILNKVLKIKDKNTVLLIKGQDIDLENELPQRLIKKTPDSKHKILFLHTDIKTVFERCKKKPWWNKEKVTFEEFKSWLQYQIRLLTKLKGFDITAIDNEDKNYPEIQYPPKI